MNDRGRKPYDATTMICISAAQKQQGRIAAVQLRAFGRRRVVSELVDSGLLLPDDDPHWYRIRDSWPAIKWPPMMQQRAPIAAELRERVYLRDGYSCVHCGTGKDLTLDHIYPHSLGGEDTFENFQTLCRPCNSRKGARLYADSLNQA